MTRYALVIDGTVTEERDYDTPPASKYRDGKPLLRPIQEVTATYNPDTQYYTVSRQVQNNKVVDTWVVHDKPRDEVNVRFAAALAAHRYAVETGGITVDGHFLPTDERTQRVVGQLWVGSVFNPALTVDSWTVNGVARTITAADIQAMYLAGFAHVQKCFRAQAAVAAAIDDYDSVADVLAAFDAALAA